MKNEKLLFLLLIVGVTVFSVTDVFAYDLTVSGQINGNYWSLESLYTESTCTVEPGTSAVLEARDGIVLGPGFCAKLGSTFTAKIGVVPDDDNDQLPDEWENQYWGDQYDLNDPGGDDDSDGLTNLDEYLHLTDPKNADTDNDGLSDSDELSIGTDPLNRDTDGDALSDGWEAQYGSDPLYNGDPSSGIFYEYDELGRIKVIMRKQ